MATKTCILQNFNPSSSDNGSFQELAEFLTKPSDAHLVLTPNPTLLINLNFENATEQQIYIEQMSSNQINAEKVRVAIYKAIQKFSSYFGNQTNNHFNEIEIQLDSLKVEDNYAEWLHIAITEALVLANDPFAFTLKQMGQKNFTADLNENGRAKPFSIKNAHHKAKIAASYQNYGRFLSGLPANLCQPNDFCQHLEHLISNFDQKNHPHYDYSTGKYQYDAKTQAHVNNTYLNPDDLKNTFKDCNSSGNLAKLQSKIHIIKREYDWLKKNNFNLFLAVAQASQKFSPPILMEMHINAKIDEKTGEVISKPKLTFVGKGITYDTGGVNLKTDMTGLTYICSDMAGAASAVSSVLGYFHNNPDNNNDHICVLACLTDNCIGSEAFKPGDIIQAKNGKSVWIWNTDAEGRLVMADALVYADQDLKSENIIDMATLTGSTVVALGHSAAGVFTKHEKLWTHLKKGGQQSGDRFYQLPMFQYYADDIEQHNLADLKNCGSRWGGGSKAACFLSNFVNENTAWAHIDMAGFMNNSDGACGYLPKVPFTGRPVRSLIGFLESFLNEKEE